MRNDILGTVKKKKKTIRAGIASFNKKGNGIGKIIDDDLAVRFAEVPFAIPGDTVLASVLRKKKGRYLSILEETETPSTNRVQPRCIHFGECGGCRWQQMSYSDQLKYKENYVRKCFEHLLSQGAEFKNAIPCNPEWRYRNKMEFSFSSDAANNHYLGLIKDSSRGKVLNISDCHLVNQWFVEALNTVRHWWKECGLGAYRAGDDTGSLRTLVIREGRRTGDRMVMLTVSGNPDYALHKHQLEGFVSQLIAAVEPKDPESKLSIFLRIQQVAKGMPTNFYEMLLYGPDHIREVLEVQIDPNEPPQKLRFHISPTAFFQPNSQQAEVLYSTALQLAEVPLNSVVYDLYCGTGTLGICAAKKAKSVIGIEVSPESALDAKSNAAFNGISNFTILSGAVRHLLTQIKNDDSYPPADLVVIDPPRPGLDPEAMKGLLNLGAKKILYISCNPETCAKDVEEMCSNGYHIKALQPIDQFAQTPHIEVVVIIEKSECQ